MSRPRGRTSSQQNRARRRSPVSTRAIMSVAIACEVKPADHEYGFDPGKRVDHKVQRQVDPFIVYGIDAAGQAIEDAGLTDMTEEERFRAGCSIGSGIGGLPGIESESLVLAEKGPKPRQPAFRARATDQPDLGPGQHQIRSDGPEPRGRHRLLDRRAFDRRRRADDRDGRRRRHAGGRCGEHGLPDRHRRLRVRRVRCRPAFNDAPEKASAAPTTSRATAS